uniref:Purple acid phosphatase N-terminal domain-containing protein n=1 Tax=uncultured bacterium A1Q1_fos_2037 TaxID=1256558 RepID=L7W1J7_9BACT|nr:hypothetical protein [uncultured bacterium A1Q1_fos_2037]
MPCPLLRNRLLAASAAILALVAWTGCRTAAPSAAPAAPLAPVAPIAPTAPIVGPAAVPGAPAAAAAPSPPYRNTIRWTTASEVDSFGFDVFRGESAEGPFERLNAKPIAGAGTSDESHSYAYVDETIDPTKDYYYYVESISIDGVREKFTPVNRAKAKAPSAAAPAP